MELLKSKLEKIVLKHFSKGSIFGFNQEEISFKKIENVKMVHEITDEEILIIYDGTLFGSAKDGMVFTEKAIYWREMLGSSHKLDYREIVESTANKNAINKTILILDKAGEVKIKEVYYDLICELREELIGSFIVYETYYKSALKSFEELLRRLAKNKQFKEIIDRINQYDGLFLKEDDKSARIGEMLFTAYLIEKDFSRAGEELEILENKKPSFYKEATSLLQGAIKQEKYAKLELERLRAMESQDFKEAYIIFDQQKALNIVEKDNLTQIELEMKNTHYETLEIDRLNNMEKEEYEIAFLLLEKQKELNIKPEIKINQIKDNMEQRKEEMLGQYHQALKQLVESKEFIKAKQIINHIYKIDPLYPLEREEILIMIYKYKLDEVRELIRVISDPKLKLELEKIFELHIKLLYEETRNAARNKDYDYFKSIPDIWKYKDEYNMSPLYYFALEGDLEGVLMALDCVDLTFMEANVFGHNFLDLICLANAPDILEKIKHKVDLKQMEDRMRFFETGQEVYFFSYHMSQEGKLLELNKSLMSPSYFENVRKDIENQANIGVDHIIKLIFAGEVEDLDDYPVKDEFETIENYKIRCQGFKQQYLDRTDFIEEYKRQNESMVKLITKRLEDKKNCFIPSLLAWIEYENKDLGILESLKTQGGMLELINLYFPMKVPKIEIGTYDADREMFFMMVDDEIEKMEIPLRAAKNFKDSFEPSKFVYHRVIEDGVMNNHCIYEFEGERFVLSLNKYHYYTNHTRKAKIL